MSERGGSDIERLWNWISRSIQNQFKMATCKFSVVPCRIRFFPTLISKIKWLGSGLPLTVANITISATSPISMTSVKMMQEFKREDWSHYFIEMLYRIKKKGRGLTALSWIINHDSGSRSLYDSFISKMVIIPSTYEAISLWDVENSGNIALSDSTPRQTITKYLFRAHEFKTRFSSIL